MIEAHSHKPLKASLVIAVVSIVSLLTAITIYGLLSTPVTANLMYSLVASEMQNSGVTNPVTAVLLNFRAYDTLIEFAVFFSVSIACLPFLAAYPSPTLQREPRDAPLFSLVYLLAPLSILLSGYMLWVGSFKPGGAFQAGALLAGSGLLLSLTNLGVTKMSGLVYRVVFSASIIFFIVAICVSYLYTKTFMMYPVNLSSGLILLVEFAATFSVAATLYLCYLTVRGKNIAETDHAS